MKTIKNFETVCFSLILLVMSCSSDDQVTNLSQTKVNIFNELSAKLDIGARSQVVNGQSMSFGYIFSVQEAGSIDEVYLNIPGQIGQIELTLCVFNENDPINSEPIHSIIINNSNTNFFNTGFPSTAIIKEKKYALFAKSNNYWMIGNQIERPGDNLPFSNKGITIHRLLIGSGNQLNLGYTDSLYLGDISFDFYFD